MDEEDARHQTLEQLHERPKQVIRLQARCIGKYLTSWGFTPQKTIKRVYEQSPAAVQAWLGAWAAEGERPAIEQRAKSERAEIHWGDETALVNTAVGGRSFAPADKKIELFYLPSNSPQLNPEERLDADLKQEMGKRVPVRTKAELGEAANKHMTTLGQSPERVMSYFQDRRMRYAA